MALNIADLAEHAIDAVPDRVALISGDETLTYAQLEDKANRLAHYLIDQGVKKDDKVGLYCRCLLYTSPSPRDGLLSRMPSSA